MKINHLIAAFLLLCLAAVYAEARTWTDTRGNTLEATYVGPSKEPGKVILEQPDGKRKVFLISQFSEDDQQYFQKKTKKRKKSETQPQAQVETQPRARSENRPEPTVELDSPAETASGGVRVRVEGYGETIKEAKQDAMRTAVEQVVGMLVDARTRTECDEVIEKILTATGAYVESNKVLKATVKDGVCTVQLEAVVVKSAISNKLQSVNRGASMKIDGSAMLDKMDSKVQSEKDGVMFLANFLKEEQFPYSLLDVSFDGEPKIEQKSGDYTYTVGWTVKVNMARYSTFIKKLTPILDKVAIRQTTFTLDLERDGKILTYDESAIPDGDKGTFTFRVCTNLTGTTNKQARFIQYELPKKFEYLICQYGRVLPSVEINLLDSSKEVVSSQRTLLQYSYSAYYLYNLSNAILGYDKYEEESAKGDSTLSVPEYNEQSVARAIIPFIRFDRNNYVLELCPNNTEFILSSDDLKKVSSAEIHVITNNPEMDKVYENLESEIDKITTE